MTDTALALTGTFDKAEIIASPGITDKRDNALAAFREFCPAIINTPAELTTCRDAFRDLREVSKLVTDAAKAIKSPLDAIGKQILRTKEKFLAEAEAAEAQLQGRINNYQQRELDKAKAIAQKAEQERAEAQRKAEVAAKELEAAKAMPSATPEDIEAAEDAALQAELAAETLPVVQAPAVRGVSGREVFDYTLKGKTDREQLESLHAFAQAYPHLVKIELKRREILEELNTGKCFRSEFPEEQPLPPDWIPKPPGLEVYRKVSTRIS